MAWSLEIISHLHEDLRNDDNPLTADLVRCGAHLEHLRNAVQSLLDRSTVNLGSERLDNLTTLAHNALSLPANWPWRRLYTDSCLFRSLADFLKLSLPAEEIVLESISRLDRAIIIAGAAGEGRLELTISIIKTIQSQCLPSQAFSQVPNLLSPPVQPRQHFQLETSFKHIPQLDAPPSLLSFQSHLSQHPFILRGFANDWPAVQDHLWQSTDYLRFVAGPGRIVPVEVGNDYRTHDWTQRLMPWYDFLAYLESPQKETLYLAQYNLLKQFPALEMDIRTPDYLYACLQPPSHFPNYKPPDNEDQFIINTWLGPRGTMSPAHVDPYYNLYFQVVGRKTVWLAPPHVSPFMCACPSPSSGTGNRSHNSEADATSQLNNTSSLNVFHSRPTEKRNEHPEFWEKVVPNAISATLEPGDLLFFPPGWWHAMRSEDSSFSVSIWF